MNIERWMQWMEEFSAKDPIFLKENVLLNTLMIQVFMRIHFNLILVHFESVHFFHLHCELKNFLILS